MPPHASRPQMARGSLSHSFSGSATPEVSYGTAAPPQTDMTSVSDALSGRRLERGFSPSQERLVYGKQGRMTSSRRTLLEAAAELDGFDDLDESLFLEQEDGEPVPTGVRKMLAVAGSLSKRGLWYLYAALVLISVILSFEGQVTPAIDPYYLSLFSAHALLSTIGVVSNIVYAISKPPTAQFLDHFGRPEGLALAATVYAIGHGLTAISTSVGVFVAARVLSAFALQGLQLTQQVLIADTTTLSNRALLTSVSSLPWMVSIWIGPPVAALFLGFGSVGYRAAYGLFGIIVPLLCLPLILALWWHHSRLQRRRDEQFVREQDETGAEEVRKRRVVSMVSMLSRKTTGSWMDRDIGTLVGDVWRQMDVAGVLLLSLCCISLLLPLSLAATRPSSWSAPWVWLSFALSASSAVLFYRHESHATHPILPSRLSHNRTLMAGCLLGMFHFACQYVYESYFSSWLQVARKRTVIEAQYISQSYIFAATVAALLGGLICKWSKRYKIWGVFGVVIHILGTLLIVRSRREGSSIWSILVAQIVSGIGGGFTTINCQLGIQAVVTHQDVARATAAFLTITQLGGALGAACSGAIWTTLLPHRLEEYLPTSDLGLVKDITGSLSVALSFAPDTPTRVAIDRAYSATQHVLNQTAVVALLPALICMLLMSDVHLGDRTAAEGIVTLGVAASVLDEEESEDGFDSDSTLSVHSPP